MSVKKLTTGKASPAAAGKAAAKARQTARKAMKPQQQEANPERQTTFLVGTNFSGSTLLGNCLNAHPSIFFAGEIDRLEAFRSDPDWTQQREHGCRLCATQAEHDCPAWPSDFLEALTPLDDISRYRAILGRTKAPILLDGSKRIDWLNSLHDAGLTSGVSAIICARNPFAFAHSKTLGETRVDPIAAAVAWRKFYMQTMRSLARRGIPSIVVRYENFAFDPASTIRRVCEFLHIPVNPGMMTHWNVASHAIGGDGAAYMRDANFRPSTLDKREEWKLDYYANKPFGGWVENKWISGLSDEAVRQVMSVPMLTDVASLLGYDLPWLVAERTRVRTKDKLRQAARAQAVQAPSSEFKAA